MLHICTFTAKVGIISSLGNSLFVYGDEFTVTRDRHFDIYLVIKANSLKNLSRKLNKLNLRLNPTLNLHSKREECTWRTRMDLVHGKGDKDRHGKGGKNKPVPVQRISLRFRFLKFLF